MHNNIMFVIGRPSMPKFGDLVSGPNGGEITATILTFVSGIDNHSDVFWFVVTPILDGIEAKVSTQHLALHYQSNTSETIIVSGLVGGQSYVLKATATNIFGSSQATLSSPVTAGE